MTQSAQPPATQPRDELAARVRAAIAYSGKTARQIGQLLDPPVEKSQVDRMKRGQWHLVRHHEDYILQLPKITGIEPEFILNALPEGRLDEIAQERERRAAEAREAAKRRRRAG